VGDLHLSPLVLQLGSCPCQCHRYVQSQAARRDCKSNLLGRQSLAICHKPRSDHRSTVGESNNSCYIRVLCLQPEILTVGNVPDETQA